jgi:hypothetical protein
MDERLASIFFGADFSGAPDGVRPPAVSARTGESLASVRRPVGQKAFADNVVKNYAGACCFPACEVRERALLVGSHVARWADDVDRRGDTSDGLSFCLLHDRAFEKGWFVLDDGLRVRMNRAHPRRPLERLGAVPPRAARSRHDRQRGARSQPRRAARASSACALRADLTVNRQAHDTHGGDRRGDRHQKGEACEEPALRDEAREELLANTRLNRPG